MPQIIEGSLSFEFPDQWQAGKYDDWSFYRNQFSLMWNGIKAVDILAVAPTTTVWLIEVKDYRVNTRTKALGLADEVALKAFHTLAALLPASVNATSESEKVLAQRTFEAGPNKQLRIALHLEQPRKHSKLFPRAIDPADIKQKLKSLVKPIDPHPEVLELSSDRPVPWKTKTV